MTVSIDIERGGHASGARRTVMLDWLGGIHISAELSFVELPVVGRVMVISGPTAVGCCENAVSAYLDGGTAP